MQNDRDEEQLSAEYAAQCLLELQNAPNLRTLDLGSYNVSLETDHWHAISQLTQLDALDVSGYMPWGISNEWTPTCAGTYLAPLTALRQLHLQMPADMELPTLYCLQQLSIELVGNGEDIQLPSSIGKLQALTQLKVSGCSSPPTLQVEPTTITHHSMFRQLPQLQQLSLSHCIIGDKAAASLGSCQHLTQVVVHGSIVLMHVQLHGPH